MSVMRISPCIILKKGVIFFVFYTTNPHKRSLSNGQASSHWANLTSGHRVNEQQSSAQPLDGCSARGCIIQFLDSCQPDERGVQSATQTVIQTRIQLHPDKKWRNEPPSLIWLMLDPCLSDSLSGGFKPHLYGWHESKNWIVQYLRQPIAQPLFRERSQGSVV